MTPTELSAMAVGGLNFMDAITAHQKWKQRLTTYVAGTSTEKLDYRVVCRDDQCVLGKWINGVGGASFGHIPLFSQLKMTHAQFHLAAGTIVRHQDEGKPEKAQDALRHGEYPQHSIKVQGLISSLYLEVKRMG
jgi:Chemoreceptor zinc-binding domain